MTYIPDAPITLALAGDETYFPPPEQLIDRGGDVTTIMLAQMLGDVAAFEAEYARVGLSPVIVPVGTRLEVEEVCDGDGCNHNDTQYLARFTEGPLSGETVVLHSAQVTVVGSSPEPVVVDLSDDALAALLKDWEVILGDDTDE